MSGLSGPGPGEGSALAAVGVSVHYGNQLVLTDVSFQVGRGDLVAVVGPNGAGKSTLFKAIVGLIGHTGTVSIGGIHCHHQRERLSAAYLPQRNDLDPDFPLSVTELVTSGRRRFTRFGRRPGHLDRMAVRDCMDRVGIGDLARRSIGTLSGGQTQRALIARALAQEAEILLFDEALNGIDQPGVEQLLDLLQSLTSDGVTILMATHDLLLARHRFDRCLAINRRLVADGPPATVLDASTLGLVFSTPAPGQRAPALTTG